MVTTRERRNLLMYRYASLMYGYTSLMYRYTSPKGETH